MAEPQYKRSRRGDAPRHDARNARDNHDSHAPASRDDRNRSYRSRSPESRDRDRAYGGTASSRAREAGNRDRRRDDLRESRDLRRDDRGDDGRKRYDERDTRDRRDDRRGSRDGRGHKRNKEDDAPKARSRSPRRNKSPQRNGKVDNNGFEREDQGLPMRERKARQVTPPAPHLKFDLNRSRANSIERDSRRSSSVAVHDTHAATSYKAEEPASMEKKRKPTAADFMDDIMDEDDEEDDVVVEENADFAAMQAMMGFGGFGTTKQKKVPGNDVGAVRKEKKTEYRQYMNRVGGFNRPLDEL